MKRILLFLALAVAAIGQTVPASPGVFSLTVTGGGGGSGTVTSVSFTGGLISVGNPTTTPDFTVAGTSGGVPYFSSASTWASSAALASGGVVIGGGAGAAGSGAGAGAAGAGGCSTKTVRGDCTGACWTTGTGALMVSAGGGGFDISCGVRTLRSGLKLADVEAHKARLADVLYARIPAGIGSTGSIRLDARGMEAMLKGGARWAVQAGYGSAADLGLIEEHGRVAGADPACVSELARKRQRDELGTLGSGNHYLEVQVVSEIFDAAAAHAYGLAAGDVVVSIHCGSRGLGHQIGTDYLREMVLKHEADLGIAVDGDADVVVFNTCAVRENAEALKLASQIELLPVPAEKAIALLAARGVPAGAKRP